MKIETGEPFGPFVLGECRFKGGALKIFEVAVPETLEVQGSLATSQSQALLYIFSERAVRSNMDPDQLLENMKKVESLRHPNIIGILDTGRVGDFVYVATEWIHGFDLATLRKAVEGRGLPPPLAVWILTQICEVMDRLHNACIAKQQGHANALHLTPSDIHVDHEGRIRINLLEITEARLATARGRNAVLSDMFGYMAPEQVEGHSASTKSDLFICGIILYELLTGERLFSMESKTKTILAIKEAKVEAPSIKSPWIDGQLDELVLYSLAKSPQQRPSTLLKWGEALDGYLRKQHPHFAPDILTQNLEVIAALSPEHFDNPVAAPPSPDTPSIIDESAASRTTLKTSAQGATMCVEAAADMVSQPTKTSLPAVARHSGTPSNTNDTRHSYRKPNGGEATSKISATDPKKATGWSSFQKHLIDALLGIFAVGALSMGTWLLWFRAPSETASPSSIEHPTSHHGKQKNPSAKKKKRPFVSPTATSVQSNGLSWKLVSYRHLQGKKQNRQLLEIQLELKNLSQKVTPHHPNQALLSIGNRSPAHPLFWSGPSSPLAPSQQCRVVLGFEIKNATLGDTWKLTLPDS